MERRCDSRRDDRIPIVVGQTARWISKRIVLSRGNISLFLHVRHIHEWVVNCVRVRRDRVRARVSLSSFTFFELARFLPGGS